MKTLDLSDDKVQHAITDLKAIEGIPTIDKIFILLVANGDKPSMHTGFFSEPLPLGQPILKPDIAQKEMLESIINDLGLSYKTQTKTLEKVIDGELMSSVWIVFCVARQPNVVEALYNARVDDDERTEGLLLGYPESAVDAFVNGTMLDMDDVPVSTDHVTANEMKLLNHRLSKDDWQQEVRYLADYARSIQQLCPELYEACIVE
jgi:hypothetical protein